MPSESVVVIRVGQPLSACPLVLQLQTYRIIAAMSAMGHEQTHAPQQLCALFDHLVSAGEQSRRNIEAERLRSLEIDAQGKMRRLLDR